MDAEAAGNLPYVVLPVGHACPCALPNQVALKLRQGGEDVEDEPAGRGICLDAFGQGNEPYSPPL